MRRCASLVVRRCASLVVRRCASLVVRRCASLRAQFRGRFVRCFGVGLGAISGVVSSAPLASFRALSCAVSSAIRALFRRLFRALSLAQSGNVSRAVQGAISRNRFVRHFGGVVSARYQAPNRAVLSAIRMSFHSRLRRLACRLWCHVWRLRGYLGAFPVLFSSELSTSDRP